MSVAKLLIGVGLSVATAVVILVVVLVEPGSAGQRQGAGAGQPSGSGAMPAQAGTTAAATDGSSVAVGGASTGVMVEAEPTPAAGMRRVAFAVEGMSCEGCAGKIRTALAEVPGIEHLTVSVTGKRASMDVSDAAPSEEKIAQTIRDLGFSVK